MIARLSAILLLLFGGVDIEKTLRQTFGNESGDDRGAIAGFRQPQQ
jgi:hypothetical protein